MRQAIHLDSDHELGPKAQEYFTKMREFAREREVRRYLPVSLPP